MNLMAVTAPRARPWSTGRIPKRFLALGLALAAAVAGAYVIVAGNPFTRGQSTPTYQTAAAALGSVRATVSATGPITNPASVPLSFQSSGKLAEVDVGVGQTVTAGRSSRAKTQPYSSWVSIKLRRPWRSNRPTWPSSPRVQRQRPWLWLRRR